MSTLRRVPWERARIAAFCAVLLFAPWVALGQPWEPDSALTPAEFDAVLNDLSYMDQAPKLSKIDADAFKLDGHFDEAFWDEAVSFSKFHLVQPATLSEPR